MARATSYASAPDVNALLTFFPTFTATSRPNATQVAFFVEQASNELDATLTQERYAVPVDLGGATLAAETLRGWAALGAAARAAAASPQGVDSKHAEAYETEWRAIIDRLRDGQLVLPGAARAPAAASRMRGPRAEASAAFAASPYFTRDSALVP